jgi:hypothetical protein
MDWLFKNFWLKVMAFGLGLLVWLHVETEKIYNHVISLPITEVTLSGGLILAEAPPDSLQVAVLASGKQLLRRKWRHEGVRINAGQYRAGRFNINLNTQNTSLVHPTTEVTLQEIISPKVLRLDIDLESSVKLPVVATLEAEADDGFAVGQQLHIEPPLATLIGPRAHLSEVDTIHTGSKKLESMRNPVMVTLPTICPRGYGFRVEPDSVMVTVPVFPVKTRVFDRVPVQVFNTPGGIAAHTEPSELRVELTGPPDEIDHLAPNSLTLSVDQRTVSASGRARIRFDCPPGFHLKSLSADSVVVISSSDADSGN